MPLQIAEYSNAFDPFVKSLAELLREENFPCTEAQIKAYFFPGVMNDKGEARRDVASRMKSYGHAKLVLDFINQNGLEGKYGPHIDQAEQLKQDVRSIVEKLAQKRDSGIAHLASSEALDSTDSPAAKNLREGVSMAFEGLYTPLGDLFRASFNKLVEKVENHKRVADSISCDESLDARYEEEMEALRQSRIDLICHVAAAALGGPLVIADSTPSRSPDRERGVKSRLAKLDKPVSLGDTPKLGAAAVSNASTKQLSFEQPPSLMSLTEILAKDSRVAIEGDPYWFDGSADYVRMGKSSEDNEVVISYDESTGAGKCVSREHAAIVQPSDGSWLLRDIESTNGTAILRGGSNVYLLACNGEMPLQSGDLILLAPKVTETGDKVSIDFNWETGAVLRFRLHHLESII